MSRRAAVLMSLMLESCPSDGVFGVEESEVDIELFDVDGVDKGAEESNAGESVPSNDEMLEDSELSTGDSGTVN